jgi:hypothetical protein
MLTIRVYIDRDAAKGDTVRLLESLYNAHKNAMLDRALGVLGDHALAEDAVHEAFLRIARHMPGSTGLIGNKCKPPLRRPGSAAPPRP